MEARTRAQKNPSDRARRPRASCSGDVAARAVAARATGSPKSCRPIQYVSRTATMPAMVESTASAW